MLDTLSLLKQQGTLDELGIGTVRDALADLLFPDEDDMVRKGVGWLLKETYPKRPEATVEFLRERHAQISRLTLRYAAEKMTPEDKRKIP